MSTIGSRRLFAIAVASVLALGAVASARAETTWQRHHPRREQVNHRLAKQNHRIHHEVKEGEMTRGRAAALHRDDHAIRTEERAMAGQDHSHITRPEQHVLNQQENRVSRNIGQ